MSKKRIKQGIKIKTREAKRWFQSSDDLAMLAANMDIMQWGKLSEYQKQLYRLRVQQAMSIFMEQSDA